MRVSAAATCCIALLLAIPSAAMAGTISVSPQKPCYRSGESVVFSGTGFTPGGAVLLNTGNLLLDSVTADAQGAFTRSVQLSRSSGQALTGYAAIDAATATTSSALSLNVSAVAVAVKRLRGAPSIRRHITARGFTTGTVLYAHVRGARLRRNVRIGRLRGACATLKARKRLLPRTVPAGSYVIQFDTNRRYSARRAARVLYTVKVTAKGVRTASAMAARR